MLGSTMLTLALATPPAKPVATEPPEAASDANEDPRDRRRNAVTAIVTFPIPDYQIGASYQRALGRHVSISGQFDYSIPRPGFGHLVGMSETVGVQAWLRRPLSGFWVEGTIGVAHTTLQAVPELSHVTVVPALGAGYTWQLRMGLLLGVGGGLRFPQKVAGSELVCTRPEMCPATRGRVHGTLALRVGWAW